MNSEQKDNTEKNLNELLPSNLVSEFDFGINEKPKNEESDFSNDDETVDVNFILIFFLGISLFCKTIKKRNRIKKKRRFSKTKISF